MAKVGKITRKNDVEFSLLALEFQKLKFRDRLKFGLIE